MDEMAGILMAVAAMFAGLLVIGWAYGEFERPKPTPPQKTTPPASS